ncbi:YTH domain-containing protein ECT2 [Cardamine amara subsp. amara]|uniref:YTH domain-containing family protein n=1 Tax=Cardamine amara subsp. amara TaxID=228776 RepID=A0ABD1A754_CARAN
MYTEGAPDSVIDQSMYYPAYYCTGYDPSLEWDNHQVIVGVDGSDVQYMGGQNENSPYICYTPSYGYAQSPYNPYNPYIPGASIGVDYSFVGYQQYYSNPPYENAASSPTYLPYVIHPDTVSNSSTDSLVATDLANGRGSRQRNPPKFSTVNSLGRTSEKLRSNTGQNKQTGIPKNVSNPASTHSLQGKIAPVDTVSSSRLLSYGQLDIASNSYKPRPKIYDGRDDNNVNGSPDTSEQNRGTRTRRSRNQLVVKAYTTKAGNADAEGNIVINADQYNIEDFSIDYSSAKFFVIKSYSEDDVHKSIKYGVWSSTLHGNKKLQSAYEDAQRIASEKSHECPIFLFFSVNSSGLFCGVAKIIGPVSFDRNMDFWQQAKWRGSFPVKWHIIKDVPNSYFRHIILHNNENKPVTYSRDTQEVTFPSNSSLRRFQILRTLLLKAEIIDLIILVCVQIMLKQGLGMLKLFKGHAERTSLLDDFMYYENRQRLMQEEKVRLPFRTFRVPFPVPKPDFSDRSKNISKDVVKKTSVTSTETVAVQLKNLDGDEKSNIEEAREDSTVSTLKIGSLTIKPTAGTTFNPTQAKSKLAPSLSSDRKSSDSSEEVTGSLADGIVSVGSLPIKVKGSADPSLKIVEVASNRKPLFSVCSKLTTKLS